MGGCASSSSKSARMCDGIGLCVQKKKETTFSSNNALELQNLSSIPNRIVTNGKSRSSCVFTQQGKKGINQDAMIVWEDYMSEDVTFFGVFDGHGPHGHVVARKVRDVLPMKLLSFLNSYQSKRNGSRGNSNRLDGGDTAKAGSTDDKSISLWRETFLKSYKAMDKELRSHPNLDCFCSGSTAVTMVKQGSNLYIGNIGDSRAILGSKDNNGSMVATQLTVDLKPDLPKEAERINRCKGRVFALQDEPEVQRVWLPFDDAPGLAMARAFGDFCLKNYGVISTPEFSHRILTEKDQFIVLASDGVWDVLSNEEVVAIVSSATSRASAARLLIDASAREWKLKYPTSKMDDCAVVCLFLDGKMDTELESDPPHQSNAVESEDGIKSEPFLTRNYTVRSSEESDSYERLTETTVDDQNWLGLEGVTRVNSLVQLPRFSEERSKP